MITYENTRDTSKELQNLLRQQFQEEKEQQSRLRQLIVECSGKPTSSKVDLLSLNSLTDLTMNAIKKKKNVLNDKLTNSKGSDHNGDANNKENNNNILMTPSRN